MATGIVAIGLFNAGQIFLARLLLAICGLLWFFFVFIVAQRALGQPERFWRETKTIGTLTSVAGTSVFGTGLVLMTGLRISYIFLVIAILIWATLIPINLRSLQKPTVGSSLLLTVSTESISVLMTTIALVRGWSWLVPLALGFSLIGVGLYIHVFRYFDFRQLSVGQGDHWILGGALAISTLAASKGAAAMLHFQLLPSWHWLFTGFGFGLWLVTMLWLPILVIFEVISPRFVYNLRRWSTVFPLGMYAACSFALAVVSPQFVWIDLFAKFWVWIGFAAWLLVALSMLFKK